MIEEPKPDYSVDRSQEAFERHRKHNLDEVTHTKGAHKVRAGLMFAVNLAGDPRGIVGDVWKNSAYRWHTWDDDGISTRSNDPAYDLPFAPERSALPPVPQDITGQRYPIAQDALLRGRRIKRAIWEGHWFLARAEYRPLYRGEGGIEGAPVYQEAVIVAALRDGTFAPAQPYQGDLMATDWIILAD